MEYRHAVLKIQYIVSKSRYHVLRFYKNNNRKHSISNACGCFEMVEATGVEPVSEKKAVRVSPGAVHLLKFPQCERVHTRETLVAS